MTTTPIRSTTTARVGPSLGVALGVVVVYMAILLGLQFASGVDFDEVAASTSNVVGIIIVPDRCCCSSPGGTSAGGDP